MDETKKYYRLHGICVDCGRYDAVPGKINCEVCALKRTEREMRRIRNMPAEKKDEYLKKHSETGKKRYHRRKSAGLCVLCEKPQAMGSTRLCVSCLGKERADRKKKRGIARAEFPSYGICYLCCKNPVLEGKKLCADCYGKSLKSMETARNSENGKKAMEYFRELEHLDFIKRTQKSKLSTYTLANNQ